VSSRESVQQHSCIAGGQGHGTKKGKLHNYSFLILDTVKIADKKILPFDM